MAAVLVPGKLALEDKDKDKNEPTNPPGDAFEACKSELSKSDSLNMKLAHLRDQSSLTPRQKLDLLNESLTLKDWNALNGRFNTAQGKSDELKKAVSENPGNMPFGKSRTLMYRPTLYCSYSWFLLHTACSFMFFSQPLSVRHAPCLATNKWKATLKGHHCLTTCCACGQ